MEHAQESSNKILAKALDGINFPATREQLVEHAKSNGADTDTLAVLKALPNDGKYTNMPDVFINTPAAREKVDGGGSSSSRSSKN